MDMTNETVGDAFSDMLIVETVLCERGWSLRDWYGTYSDLPNRLAKVTVKVIITIIIIVIFERINFLPDFSRTFRTEICLRRAMPKGFVPDQWAFRP